MRLLSLYRLTVVASALAVVSQIVAASAWAAFTDQSTAVLSGANYITRSASLADYDSDGDLDLIVDSDEGPVWYENIGSQAKPVMQLRGVLVKASLAGHSPTPNLFDWNGDGKLDLIVGAEDGFFYYFDGRYIERLGGR